MWCENYKQKSRPLRRLFVFLKPGNYLVCAWLNVASPFTTLSSCALPVAQAARARTSAITDTTFANLVISKSPNVRVKPSATMKPPVAKSSGGREVCLSASFVLLGGNFKKWLISAVFTGSNGCPMLHSCNIAFAAGFYGTVSHACGVSQRSICVIKKGRSALIRSGI